MPLRGNGMGYEAEEVMRCLRAGLTESPLVPLDDTLAVMGTLDAVRDQIGVRTTGRTAARHQIAYGQPRTSRSDGTAVESELSRQDDGNQRRRPPPGR